MSALKEVERTRELILGTFNKLQFIEETHQYFLPKENGDLIELDCVSHVTHKFQEPFDSEKIATNYAIKHGETKDYWLDKWRYNSLKATTTGTLVHEFGESMAWLRNGHPERVTESCKCKLHEKEGWLIPTRTKEEAIIKFWDDLHPNLHFVLAETKVYSGSHENAVKLNQDYAGTFDLLMYYHDENNPKNSGLVIMDYKTNVDLYKDFSRQNNKMLYPPFNNMYNENLSLYTLQLSCYQIPLEDIGLKVVGRRIIWLKDDGTYELLPVPDVTKKLKSVL